MLLNKVPVDSGNIVNVKTFFGFTWKEIIHKIFLPWVTAFKYYLPYTVLITQLFVLGSYLGSIFERAVCVPCVLTGASRSEGDTGSPGSGDTDVCESPCWCQNLNLDPLQEQQMLFSPQRLIFKGYPVTKGLE